MTGRRAYVLNLRINGRQINKVVMDPHYQAKHPDISDALILELVKQQTVEARQDGNDIVISMPGDAPAKP